MFYPLVKTSRLLAENVEVLVFLTLSLFDASLAVYNITNEIPDLSLKTSPGFHSQYFLF